MRGIGQDVIGGQLFNLSIQYEQQLNKLLHKHIISKPFLKYFKHTHPCVYEILVWKGSANVRTMSFTSAK